MMQFAVEAWDPDYGTGGDVDALDPSTDVVDAGVERPIGKWEPISPPAAPADGVVYFVDGVRRIDARIWVTDNGQVLPGSCATVAAGAVACTGTDAFVSDVEVRRRSSPLPQRALAQSSPTWVNTTTLRFVRAHLRTSTWASTRR